MDTSDSEAFESADENFDNDTNFKESDSDDEDSDSNVKTVVSSKKVHNEIDDISNLLDNLQVKFEHCRTLEDDTESSEPTQTSVWDNEDLENLNTSPKASEEVKSTSEITKVQSGWDDFENLNTTSPKAPSSEEVKSSSEITKVQSGWEDFENLNTTSPKAPSSEEVKSSSEITKVQSGWEDFENLNTTTSKTSSSKVEVNESLSKQLSETIKNQSGWDDLENLNIESSKTITKNSTKFAAHDHVESSGWNDEDLENLIAKEKITTSLKPTSASENVSHIESSKETTKKTIKESKNIQSGWDDLENVEEKISTTKFAASDDVESSSWDEEDLENLNIESSNKQPITVVNPSKFAACEDDVDTSGWDNDVDWEPIEDDDKVEKASTGWDDFDTWDTIEDAKTTPPQHQPQPQSNVWSAWGVTSLLSSATEGVTTFTSQVSQGLTTVLESSIGVPSPEELAKAQKLERAKLQKEIISPPVEEAPQSDEISSGSAGGVFGFGNLLTGVTHITKLVETTSSKVMNTGLDTLETIGKKTMEVLQEGDPGLVKKRALLGLNPDKPCLSQVLREAKEKASVEDAENAVNEADNNKRAAIKKVHFETLFDDYQGLVHLEALEMLSKQCDIKLCTIIESMQDGTKELEDIQETMVQIKELCELPDDEDDDNNEQLQQLNELKVKLNDVVDELGLQTPITFTKLFEYWTDAEQCMKSITDDVHEIHRMGIDTLAKITSMAVEQFHKCAELLLIKERRSTADEADSLVQITTTLTTLIGVIAAKYSEKLDSLSASTDNPDLNALITNIFFEATQSSSYVQDAFQLFIPILQIGAV